METLKENFTILIELQEKYGEIRNYKELQHMLDNAKFICDSGYFTDDNLEYMDKNGLKCLIMPKRLSQEINNELRKKNKIPEKKNKKIQTNRTRTQNQRWIHLRKRTQNRTKRSKNNQKT